ncbi:MAG: F0F1 ATP synthase subunit epsilon [Marmoricola sp.]
MAKNMHVSLVAADREVWSGEAVVVNATTVAGEIGVLADHIPVLSVLVPGQIDVRTEDGHWVAATDGGFISVANNEVRLLCEFAEISHESSFAEAQRLLEAKMSAAEAAS